MTQKDLTDYVLIDGEEYYVENHDPHFIDKDKAMEHLDGDLEYIGYWWVKDAKGYVFKDKNPDRSKNHKDYVVLKHVYNYHRDKYDVYVAGYDEAPMEERSIQSGLACKKCKTVVWSLDRHDYHGCQCKKEDDSMVCVDGGMDYIRTAFSGNSECISVIINHRTRQISRPKRNTKKA